MDITTQYSCSIKQKKDSCEHCAPSCTWGGWVYLLQRIEKGILVYAGSHTSCQDISEKVISVLRQLEV